MWRPMKPLPPVTMTFIERSLVTVTRDRSMKVMVTGGSGFIGRHIVEQLGDRYEIVAPSHAELELTDADAVAAWLTRHPVDAVIHAAVRPGHRNSVDPSRQLDMNLRMYTNLVRCREYWGRLLYLSSGAIYGAQHD